MENEKLLTVKEVAERLRVHTGTVRRWLEEEKLHGYRLGGSTGWRVNESEVARFLQERAT